MLHLIGDRDKLPVPHIDWNGTAPERIRLAFGAGSAFRMNEQWYHDHEDTIRRDYSGSWICIVNQELFVGSTEAEVKLLAKAKYATESSPLYTRFIPPAFVPSQHAI
jgi:hypothetical protein